MMRLFSTPRVFLATAVLASSIAPVSAQSAPGSRVLVMPFAAEVQPGAPGGAAAAHWIGEAAAVLLEEGLAGAGVTVFSREERLAAFDRLQLPSSSVLTRATMIRVGELVGASEVVFGEVRLADRLSVRARIIQIGPGREASDVTDQGAMPDMAAVFDRVSRRIAAATGRPVVPAAVVTPMPFEAFESYMKGLVALSPAAQQRLLEGAMALAPKDPRVQLALWDVYTGQGLHDKALASANAVAANSPLARRARFDVALSLIELRRLDGAFKELSGLQAARRSAVLANALGIVQLRRTTAVPDTPAAATFFQQAVEAEPGNTDFLFNLGYAYAIASNASTALLWLRESVRYDAANGDAHLVMSAVLAASGRSAEAQREFDLARVLGTRLEAPGSAPPAKVPAGLERLETDLDHAGVPRLTATLSTPAQADQRETAAFHLSQGRTLVAARKDREATEALRRAIYLAPYEEEPHRLLGEVYQRAGRLPEAIDEFKVALWCRETAAGHIALGHALLDSGDRDAARRELDRALILAPDSAEARALQKRFGG